VSLNILGQHPAHPWIDQSRFDMARNTVAEALTLAPSEALATLAVNLGGEAGRALLDHLAIHHPHPRMRATALAARCSAGIEGDGVAMLERVAADPQPALRAQARDALAGLAS
jgi:hypothetical protein